MHIRKQDVLTPANLLSVIGLTFVIAGAIQLETLRGVMLFGIGRSLDVFDGLVARRTHTSDLGAIIDAVADKSAVLVITIAVLVKHLMPWPAVAYIVLCNFANMVINLYAEATEHDVTTNRAGKREMFLHTTAVFLFLLGHALKVSWLNRAAWVVLALSLPYAYVAARNYYKAGTKAVKVRRSARGRRS
jgi:phosphatidylglycerophosphate synthase